MKTYLAEQPAWLECTEHVRTLAGKSVMVVDQGHRIPAQIDIRSADPDGTDRGKCALRVWQASITPLTPEWTSGGIPPTSQGHLWQVYLTADALALLHRNDCDPEDGDLMLEIPKT
jgi:hypothetical protein